MSSAFRRVALIGKLRSAEIADSLRELRGMLEQRGCEVLIERETASDLGLRGVDYAAIGAGAKLAIVVGGDGTMLAAARNLVRHHVPLVGVNQGRVGFMTDIGHDDMRSGIGAILDGKFSIEERALVRALDARAHFDGFALADMQQGDRLLLKRSADAVRFAHPPGYSYFATLREKLRWSEVLEKNRDLE